MKKWNLNVYRNNKYAVPAKCAEAAAVGILVTPQMYADNDDFILFEVKVDVDQSVVAFPKFGTVGIGFRKESKDWNTNLPYTCEAEKIYEHIKVNKCCKAPKARVIQAIKNLQSSCSAYECGMGVRRDAQGQRINEKGERI